MKINYNTVNYISFYWVLKYEEEERIINTIITVRKMEMYQYLECDIVIVKIKFFS